MKKITNFLIQAEAPLFRLCRELEITNFHEAVHYIFKYTISLKLIEGRVDFGLL
jgi:hypothetical protein